MKSFIICLFISLTVKAQTGEEIMKASAEKIRALKALTFSVYSEQSKEKVNATVSIKRGGDFNVFETAMIRLQGISMSDEETKQVSFAFDGNSFSFWDSKLMEQVKLDSPTYNKLGRTGLMLYTMLIPSAYWQKEPFGVLLKTLVSAERLNDTVIYSSPCYQVKVTGEASSQIMGTQRFESTWFIGIKDSLIYGTLSRTSKLFFKPVALEKELSNEYFSVLQSSRRITGTEPIGDGLLSKGTKAPLWTLPTENGSLSMENLKGKVVLLDFWGTWCVPCIKAMPDIQAIHEKFKDEPVSIIGVSVEMEKFIDPIVFMKKRGYSYPIALDGRKITEAYKVQQFPSVYLINQEGAIIHAEHSGGRENFKEDIIERIKQALKK